jgi:hypothetical protein
VKIINFDEGEFVLRGRGAVESRWTRMVMRLPALEQQRMRLEAERAAERQAGAVIALNAGSRPAADGR